MLTESKIIPYLIEERFIEPESVVTDRIRIINAARRNENFHVTGLSGPNYFLKRGTHNVDIGSIANEAAVYYALQSPHLNGRLGRYIPHCFGYNAQTGILTLEAIPNAENLQQYHARERRFPKIVAVEMGKALGVLHDFVQYWPEAEKAQLQVTPVLPTVFRLNQPPLDILKGASGVCIELIKLLQQHRQFGEEFTRLAEQWQTDAIIHGDIKLSNLVTYRRRSSGRLLGVKLIDWEFAGLGDALWDVGSVFSCYLALWLFSVPIAKHDQPDQLLDLARFPLVRIQPAIRLFWKTYCETRQMDERTEPECLTDAMRFAAACLVQTAYEFAKGSNYLTTEIISLMQLSLNIFQRPEQAAVQLLGLTH